MVELMPSSYSNTKWKKIRLTELSPIFRRASRRQTNAILPNLVIWNYHLSTWNGGLINGLINGKIMGILVGYTIWLWPTGLAMV